jgi:hypothetical protein
MVNWNGIEPRTVFAGVGHLLFSWLFALGGTGRPRLRRPRQTGNMSHPKGGRAKTRATADGVGLVWSVRNPIDRRSSCPTFATAELHATPVRTHASPRTGRRCPQHNVHTCPTVKSNARDAQRPRSIAGWPRRGRVVLGCQPREHSRPAILPVQPGRAKFETSRADPSRIPAGGLPRDHCANHEASRRIRPGRAGIGGKICGCPGGVRPIRPPARARPVGSGPVSAGPPGRGRGLEQLIRGNRSGRSGGANQPVGASRATIGQAELAGSSQGSDRPGVAKTLVANIWQIGSPSRRCTGLESSPDSTFEHRITCRVIARSRRWVRRPAGLQLRAD